MSKANYVDIEKEKKEERSKDQFRHSDEYNLYDVSTVTTILKQRLRDDKDGQVIITSKGSQRGLGKTTLALHIAKRLDDNFTAKEKCFVDVHEYLTKYKEADSGSVLILDEAEKGADSRRAMSKENVDLTQGWASMRYKNIVSIVTLPDIGMLDKRLLRLADFRINVIKRGVAVPFWINVNDFTGDIEEKTIRRGGSAELMFFSKISKNDSDYRYLNNLKDRAVKGSYNKYSKEELEKQVKNAKKKTEKEVRDKYIYKIYNGSDLTQENLSSMLDVSQSTVYRAIKKFKDNDKNDN